MNNYHIYEEVGRGKYSVVYKGRIKKSIKYVAVKSVERSRRRKLMNEVRIFHDLSHKNILKFYNWYETRNHLWIIFEYCAGGDVYQLIEQDKKLPEESVRKFAIELIEGLSYLHSNGIIYSDLKPSNILLNEYGVLKLCDFGLSKKITDMGQPEVADPSKPKAGTPYYMAPELFQDNGIHSYYSDFWSMGCLLFELATGKPPFCTNSLKDLITMILEADFPRIDGFSQDFNDLLGKLLEKDPLKRINWDEIKIHSFFKGVDITKRVYPHQPQFDIYLRSRGIIPEHFFDQRSNAKKLGIMSSSNKVDILRLSYNVRRNLKKEEDDENGQYGQQVQSKESSSSLISAISTISQQEQVGENDINLKNRKMVLNFGEKEEDDDDSYKGPSGGSGNITPNSANGQNALTEMDINFNMLSGGSSNKQKISSNQFQAQNQELEEEMFENVNIQMMPPKKTPVQQIVPQQQQQIISKQQPKQTSSNTSSLANPVSSSNTSLQKAPQTQKDLMLLINQQMFSQSSSSGINVQASQKADPNQMKIPHKTIDQLLMHNSDTAVKPIIGNKEIEKIVDTPYDINQLSFQPWPADQILQKIDTPQIEAHLNELYNAIAQNTSINEKANALLYFESIIVNSNVSNRLINSAFMNLLVKMMKTIKTPQIRIRLCSVIGLLIRHSTVIENELAESEICPQLIETMKDKNEKVRKKAIAALGEYMFYAATQLDDEQADSCWEISDDAISVIVRSLREQEDETVRFYACKTLENITAQSNSAGDRFASAESVNFLLAIFLSPQTSAQYQGVNENMRISSACALSHICKLQPKLFPLIFNKINPKQFCYTLIEGQQRVQQAFITMLNQALALNSYPKINDILLQEDSFLKSLIRLLEHHSIVVRGKVLLTFLLLFKQDFRWMAIVDPEVKFFHVLDRLTRDNYKYVQCCLLCLVDGIVEILPQMFQAISEELHILLNGGRTALVPTEFEKKINRSEFENLQGNPIYIAIILDLQQAQVIKSRIVNFAFIRSIATLIDICDIYSFQGAEEFLNALLLITESMSSNQKMLMQMNEPILTYMLPVLLNKIKSDSADIRFLSLKIFTDIVIQYINDDTIYDIKGGESQQIMENGNNIKTTTKQINDLLLKQLFPFIESILKDNDPVPQFGLKLLSAIVERNPVYVTLLKKFDLFHYISENYQVNHPRLNRYTIIILKSVVESKELSFLELQQFRVIDKTNKILQNMIANKQDFCTEMLLDIIREVLTQFNEVVKTREGEISKQIEEIFNNFDICVQLLSLQYDISIVEKASQCLIQMLQLYALCQQKKKEIFFVENHMNFLINALKTDKKIIQKRVLKCIYWALIQSEYQIKMKQDKKLILEQLIMNLLQCEDRSIGNTSKEIYKILQEQNSQGGGYENQMIPGQQMNFYHNNLKSQ